MNRLEYEMLETLKKLKNEYGVFQIKAEYENEGSRQVELMRLKDIADTAGLPIILKIGGVEAVSDMYEALSIGAKGIIAPMCETAYAASKFLDAIEKFIAPDNRADIEFAINIETMMACTSFPEMLSLKNINLLSSITFGRVDFVGSLHSGRDSIEYDHIFSYYKLVFQRAKEKGLNTALGGAISPRSENAIKFLLADNLLDKYETRKIVYNASEGMKTFQEGLAEGIKFELQWLKSKRRYYHLITIEDEKRISMLEERVNG
jgi:4-hydroxy-2-oxoheptanedioate aldolase